MPEQQETQSSAPVQDPAAAVQPRKIGLKLFRKIVIYHAVLAAVFILIAAVSPDFLQELPIGGVTRLEERGDVTIESSSETPAGTEDTKIVDSLIDATSQLDRLGYARKLIIVLISVWLLMLPVSWVNRGMHTGGEHDHSLDETTLLLPGVVAAIVLVVQHSLALAFSLAGIIAGVQFRRALQDTFDALFILVAIGVGIAAGVEALEIAAVLSVFFTYATLYVTFYGDGLETHYEMRRKLEKKRKKALAKARDEDDD